MCRFKLKQNNATTFMHFHHIIKWLNPRETFMPPPLIKMYMVKVYSKFVCIIPGVDHTLTIYIFWWRGGGSKNPHLGNYPFKLVPVLIVMEILVIHFINKYKKAIFTPTTPPHLLILKWVFTPGLGVILDLLDGCSGIVQFFQPNNPASSFLSATILWNKKSILKTEKSTLS